ncbi:hypothetical protein BC567DRAFT_237693, partial [Phyllosticta citribraziliensis]
MMKSRPPHALVSRVHPVHHHAEEAINHQPPATKATPAMQYFEKKTPRLPHLP